MHLIKRGTRAQVNAAAVANQLTAGQLSLITDEGRLAVSTGAGFYVAFAKQSEVAGIVAISTVEINLGYPLRRSGSFVIPGSGMTIGKPVSVWLARGPYTGKGTAAGEESMYPVQLTGQVTSPTEITCSFACQCRIGGNIKFNYVIGG